MLRLAPPPHCVCVCVCVCVCLHETMSAVTVLLFYTPDHILVTSSRNVVDWLMWSVGMKLITVSPLMFCSSVHELLTGSVVFVVFSPACHVLCVAAD